MIDFIPAFRKQIYFCDRPNDIVLVRFGLKSFGEFPKEIVNEFLIENKLIVKKLFSYYVVTVSETTWDNFILFLKISLL